MTKDKKSLDLKKPSSSSFIWILAATFFLALIVQNIIASKEANVAFSYQLEHLVNLGLIQPENSKKIALNDNLVTFSGKFRDKETEEGKLRFKYLEILNEQHSYTEELEGIKSELAKQKDEVIQSVSFLLALSGKPIPKEGYTVIDDRLKDPKGLQKIVVQQKDDLKIPSLEDLKQRFVTLKNAPTLQSIEDYNQELQNLVLAFRSQRLGIGAETEKNNLRGLENDLRAARITKNSQEADFALFDYVLTSLDEIVATSFQWKENMRFSSLRSIRNYNEALVEYSDIQAKLQNTDIKLDKAREKVRDVVWYYENNELSTRALERQNSESYLHWFVNAKEEWEGFPKNKAGFFKAPDQPLNKVLEKKFKSEEPSGAYTSSLIMVIFTMATLGFLYYLFSKQMKGMGSNAMSFGKSPAKLMDKEKNKVTFKDVAGIEEALEELEEIVEFLKNPQKFTNLGGHIPKGVLCVGPPGTGKTLIAKAVAGEADCPFFSISGSDFVEMFVGVGASRIRDMFDQAKKSSPCIIFIDEIDAVGRHRGAGIGGGHDEREQTLNQLLVEMDGFDSNEGVILIAATNRPDVLDKALLRPGRFDRRVVINLPDVKGRYEILKVHAKKIKLAPDVDLMAIAKGTPGSSGADLENMLNEAALLAARRNKKAVTNREVIESKEKVLYGKERRSLEMDENEKLTTAFHESGHTVVALAVDHSDPIDKVTIIPRGFSLGATHFLPEKNRLSYWKKELVDQLAVLMGGRCAEEIFVHDMSSGAQKDIEQATALARAMVCEWGMNEKMGTVAYDERHEGGQYLGMQGHSERKYSEETAKEIDIEVRLLLDTAHKRAIEIIKDKRDVLQLMTDMLMEFETLTKEDIHEIYNSTWDSEKKKTRMREEEEKHKRKTPTPPPPPEDADKVSLDSTPIAQDMPA
jgi:cell division protease FtsH